MEEAASLGESLSFELLEIVARPSLPHPTLVCDSLDSGAVRRKQSSDSDAVLRFSRANGRSCDESYMRTRVRERRN